MEPVPEVTFQIDSEKTFVLTSSDGAVTMRFPTIEEARAHRRRLQAHHRLLLLIQSLDMATDNAKNVLTHAALLFESVNHLIDRHSHHAIEVKAEAKEALKDYIDLL